MDLRLVFLDRHDEVGLFFFDKEPGMVALGMHGIGGDGYAGKVERGEKRSEGGDLVGLLSYGDVGDGESSEMKEGGQKMDRLPAFGGAAAEGLAVDGEIGRAERRGCDPFQERLLEGAGIEASDCPVQGGPAGRDKAFFLGE